MVNKGSIVSGSNLPLVTQQTLALQLMMSCSTPAALYRHCKEESASWNGQGDGTCCPCCISSMILRHDLMGQQPWQCPCTSTARVLSPYEKALCPSSGLISFPSLCLLLPWNHRYRQGPPSVCLSSVLNISDSPEMKIRRSHFKTY